jgi:hypothetical protein
MAHVLTNNICRARAPRKSTRFNPARAAKFPDGAVPRAQKHCAAQAEYTRLAAQAYSPSDAMSQARFCLGGMKKGSTPFQTNLPGDLRAETAAMRRTYLLARVGVVLQIFPVIGDLAA